MKLKKVLSLLMATAMATAMFTGCGKKEDVKLTILDTEYAVEDYAAAISKENAKLLEDFNKALKELKEDGTIDKIIAKYIPVEVDEK